MTWNIFENLVIRDRNIFNNVSSASENISEERRIADILQQHPFYVNKSSRDV